MLESWDLFQMQDCVHPHERIVCIIHVLPTSRSIRDHFNTYQISISDHQTLDAFIAATCELGNC